MVVKNYVDPAEAAKLADIVREDANAKHFRHRLDEGKLNPKDLYAVGDAYSLLRAATIPLSKFVGEKLYPTYALCRIYNRGHELLPHTDRENCELSATLHVSGDKPWEIFMRDPQGVAHGVVLEPGDAVVYLGCEAEHWREPYQGNEYIQVFMHYVFVDGPHWELAFMNAPNVPAPA